MKPAVQMAISGLACVTLLGAIAFLAVSDRAGGQAEAGYEALLASAQPDLITLDSAQLRSIAPFAIQGTLVTLPNAGTDMRKDKSGNIVDNFALACLTLQDGAMSGRLVRLQAGQALPVHDPNLARRILVDRPCPQLTM